MGISDPAARAVGPGPFAVRRSAAANALGMLLGWGVLVGGGVLGGLVWSWHVRSAEFLFLPMFAAYAGFASWLWLPTGYGADESGITVFRPRGTLKVDRARIVGVLAAPEITAEFSVRLGANWLRMLPVLQSGPQGSRLLWIDPEISSGYSSGPHPKPWALPVWGAFLIWGGFAGKFWDPQFGVHRRYCRSFRPRLGLWIAPEGEKS